MYESLPLSILVHAIAIGAFMGAGLWKVTFPDQTPKMLMLYTLAAEPTPPPPPPPPAAPRPVVTQVQPVPTMPIEDLAPTVIPEEVPLVLPSASIADLGPRPTGIVGGVDGGIEGGVVGGVVDGSPEGVAGGTVGGIVVADVQPPDTVIIKRDQPLPMRAMSQVYPRYPEEARIRGQQDMLLIRYIIGKNGRVREVIVLQKPERKIFEEATVRAIRQWRFKPYIKDGVPQEVIHELTVFFKLNA